MRREGDLGVDRGKSIGEKCSEIEEEDSRKGRKKKVDGIEVKDIEIGEEMYEGEIDWKIDVIESEC